MVRRLRFLAAALLCASCVAGVNALADDASYDTAIVVLGTRPFNQATPTLDMVTRVEEGVGLFASMPRAVLVFTGGPTAGPVSEAQMMARMAYTRGVAVDRVLTENASRSTDENARNTAALLKPLALRKTVLVTRPGHLKRAMKVFSAYPEFGALVPYPTNVSKDVLIRNLQDYLRHDKKSLFARQQIHKIEQE